MKPLVCQIALLLLVLGGCAPGSRPAPRPETAGIRPGHVRVAIADRLSWPYRLHQVLAVLDGVPVLRLERGADPSRAAVEVPLVAGVHTIAVQVVAALPSGVAGEQCLVRLRTSLSFGAGHDPVSILLVPYLGHQTADFAKRLELQLRLRGTRPISDVEHLPDPAHAACTDLPVIERALCLAEARVAEARRLRDVIALACYMEKLERMRELDALGSPDAAQRIEQLLRELEACVGCPQYEFGPRTERMAYSQGCGDVDDLLEDHYRESNHSSR